MTEPRRRGRGRPRTGSVEPHDDHWDARATLPDGSHAPRVCLPPDTSKAKAREIAAHMTELAAAQATPEPAAPVVVGESFAAWSVRWLAARRAAGQTTVDDQEGCLRKWVLPRLGARPFVDITRLEIEQLVEDLDTRVQAGQLAWKTAANAWGLVTKACDDACNSKVLALRILRTNPAEGVRGPDRGAKRSKAFLYPSEVERLLACEQIPMLWRRLYAVTIYLYIRAAETRALEWPDIEIDRGVVLIHRTEDDEGAIHPTKGKRTRRYSAEASLLPLLRWMREQANAIGRLFPRMPVEKHLSPMLRRHLLAAGITRADLFANDATRQQIRFHDLRASGITWCAVRGDDPLKIMYRAGHEDFTTTQEYIRAAEAIRDGFGEAFPAVPAALLTPGISPEWVGANGHAYGITHKRLSGRRDLNPRSCAGLRTVAAYFTHGSRLERCSEERSTCASDAAKCVNARRWAKVAGESLGAWEATAKPLAEATGGLAALLLLDPEAWGWSGEEVDS